MRKGIMSARIYPAIQARLAHAKGELAGLPSEEFTPSEWKEENGVLLYFHGGGYIVCGPRTHRDLISRIAVSSGARAVAIDYRKAPEHPFPAAVDDCFAAYRALLDQGTPAGRIALGGDSAGGGLVLAVLQRIRDARLPMPRAGILLSPWCDLEGKGASVSANAKYDYIQPEGLEYGRRLYLAGQDPLHPEASPAYADLTGFPPLLMQTGGAELFRSENEALAERAVKVGVRIRHEVEPGMVHVFQAFATFFPEARPAVERLGEFIRNELGQVSGDLSAAVETGAPVVEGAFAAGE
jgi:acetyl esterase/lipase